MTGIKIFILFFFCVSVGLSQTDSLTLSRMSLKDLKKLGNNASLQEDYNTALDYYQVYLKKMPTDPKVLFKTAEAYRKVRDYDKAEKTYYKAYDAMHKESDYTCVTVRIKEM